MTHHLGYVEENGEFILWQTGKGREVARISVDDAVAMTRTILRCVALQTHKEEVHRATHEWLGSWTVRCSQGDAIPIVGTLQEIHAAFERHLRDVAAAIVTTP